MDKLYSGFTGVLKGSKDHKPEIFICTFVDDKDWFLENNNGDPHLLAKIIKSVVVFR